MNLKKLFKKESSKNSNSKTANIQKMDAKQLSKVIGGGGSDVPDETAGAINTSRSNIKHSN